MYFSNTLIISEIEAPSYNGVLTLFEVVQYKVMSISMDWNKLACYILGHNRFHSLLPF